MYVARFSDNIQNDIERGWSGYFAEFDTDVRSALLNIGVAVEEDKLETRQQRWINTYGDAYEDYESFLNEYLLELAEEHNLRQDPHTQAWRPFHHQGLSCFALEADNLDSAIREATEGALSWGGFGQATVGTVKALHKITGTGNLEKDDFLWILECDDVKPESDEC